jgi:hypothetical protein
MLLRLLPGNAGMKPRWEPLVRQLRFADVQQPLSNGEHLGTVGGLLARALRRPTRVPIAARVSNSLSASRRIAAKR